MAQVPEAESLFRRIPAGWYQAGSPKPVPQVSFMPREWKSEEKPGDRDGLSVDVCSMTTLEKTREPVPGMLFHVAQLTVKAVTSLGMSCHLTDDKDNPAHAIVPEMNSIDLKDEAKGKVIRERALALRNSCTLVFAVPPKPKP